MPRVNAGGGVGVGGLCAQHRLCYEGPLVLTLGPRPPLPRRPLPALLPLWGRGQLWFTSRLGPSPGCTHPPWDRIDLLS